MIAWLHDTVGRVAAWMRWMSDLRTYLIEHPALVYYLGFERVLDPAFNDVMKEVLPTYSIVDILPNLSVPIIVYTTLLIPNNILYEAALSYLLLESHPLLQAEARTAAKRVSPQETGLPREYRGGQAFLLGRGDAFGWSATRLEALRATSYAVTSTTQTLYLPAEGPVVGQSVFAFDNQGASDLSLPPAPEPTYAAFGGEAVFLTKNAKGDLWLPLASGPQSLLLQSRQKLGRSLGDKLVTGAVIAPPAHPAREPAFRDRIPHRLLRRPLIKRRLEKPD